MNKQLGESMVFMYHEVVIPTCYGGDVSFVLREQPPERGLMLHHIPSAQLPCYPYLPSL